MGRPELSLIIPIFNEESVIPELDRRLRAFVDSLGIATEIVFVNDGSKDRSLELLKGLAEGSSLYRVINLSRNFGHQMAITAGVDRAEGEAIVVMDADLQDPPEVVLAMVEKWREGYDVVYGKRRTRAGETWFKKITAKWFYKIFAAMVPIDVPLDTGDFRLMSRRVAMALSSLRESHRFVRGLVAWLGYRQIAIHYDREERFAGETKYPLRKMLRFALDGITSFSVLPLRFAMWLAVLVGIFSIFVAIWAVVAKFVFHDTVQGWTGMVVLVSILTSVQLFTVGVLGEYVGRIYEQVKGRPLYLIEGETRKAVSSNEDAVKVAADTSKQGVEG